MKHNHVMWRGRTACISVAVAVLALRVLGPEHGCTHAAANFDENVWARTPLKRREIITKMHRSEKWSLAEGAQS